MLQHLLVGFDKGAKCVISICYNGTKDNRVIIDWEIPISTDKLTLQAFKKPRWISPIATDNDLKLAYIYLKENFEKIAHLFHKNNAAVIEHEQRKLCDSLFQQIGGQL